MTTPHTTKTPTTHSVNIQATAKTQATVSTAVTRGNESWTYFYVMIALALAFTWTLIQVWGSWLQMLSVFVSTIVLIYFFLFNGWFQNTLIKLKIWYETKPR